MSLGAILGVEHRRLIDWVSGDPIDLQEAMVGRLPFKLRGLWVHYYRKGTLWTDIAQVSRE